MKSSSWLTIFVMFGLVLVSGYARAQSGLKCAKVPVGVSFKVDSFPIVQSSVILPDDVTLRLDGDYSTVFLSGSRDSVMMCYRTFPFRPDREIYSYDLSLKDTLAIFSTGVQDFEVREELFSSPGIEKRGVLSRGISLGNRQDVFVNSNLNLQMQGELADGIKLNAVISDQNIPFQPEGNTQQIQEFDQIFINLNHTNWSLNAGDILMKEQGAFYMKYFKKVQGVHFDVETGKDTSVHQATKSYVSAALAKGKFNTMLLSQIEGVQGPYRLTGANGERFIIIIANTEKVFLDGRELKRGFDYDYTIDYNTAEITFNNTLVITKFSRIRVDFEYTERNYARSVYNFGHQHSFRNSGLSLGIDYFHERDNRQQFLQGELPVEQQIKLSEVGDSIQDAVVPSSRLATDEFGSRILYQQKDTLGIVYYEYSTASSQNSDSTLYVVEFTQVANGQGDYNRQISTVNGRVYEWVGQGNGNYLPVSVIPAPNKREMVLLKGTKKVGKSGMFGAELAFSNKDVNLFSELDDQDDQGKALRLTYVNSKIPLKQDKLWLVSDVDYQFQDKRFNPLDRIRHVDFERDWNTNPTQKATEHIGNVTLAIRDVQSTLFSYRAGVRSKQGYMNGLQQELDIHKDIAKVIRLKWKMFSMDNAGKLRNAQWRRAFLRTEVIANDRVHPGYEFNMDKNRMIEQDSVLRPLMNYDEHVLFVKGGDSLKGTLNLEHRIRSDYLPVSNKLDWVNSEWANRANTSSISYGGKVSPTQEIKVTGSYRSLISHIDSTDTDSSESNILGRLDWNARGNNGAITSNFVYVVNTSRELIRELQYIPVLQSQGTHIWIDYNGDGVKDLDEFQQIVEGVNAGADTLYAKFFFPTSDYIKAFSHNLNYRFTLRSPRKWRVKKGVKQVLSRFQSTTYLVMDKKTTDDGLNERLNPFSTSVGFDALDENVLSLKRNVRSTLFFNRSNPNFGADVSLVSQGAKQLLTYGQDGRYLEELRFNNRILLKKKYTLKLTASQQSKESRSNYLLSREYSINVQEAGTKISFQPSRSVRLTGGYDVGKRNGFSADDNPSALIQEGTIELKVRKLSNSAVTISSRYVNIAFNSATEGGQNSPLSYDLLQALSPGNNFLWKFSVQRRLSNGLNVNLLYEGRKSGDNPVVHTGSMQVSALF